MLYLNMQIILMSVKNNKTSPVTVVRLRVVFFLKESSHFNIKNKENTCGKVDYPLTIMATWEKKDKKKGRESHSLLSQK